MAPPRSMRPGPLASVACVPLAGLLGCCALGAHAQPAATQPSPAARGFSLTPEVTVTQTLTDNVDVNAANKRGGSITEVSPHLRVDSNGGRFKGAVDYALDGLLYLGHGSTSTIQQSLDANANVEAIADWAYVDARANVGQQAVSAFGTQSADPSLRNGNQTQVSSFQVQPYVRGMFGSLARYEARASYAREHGDATTSGNSTTTGATLLVADDNPGKRLGWSVDASDNTVDYREGRRTEIDRGRASLIYAAMPDLRLSLRDGHEVNNIASAEHQGNNTPGWGLVWTPSERTKIAVDRDRRFFGNSHSVNVEYRTARTVWRFSDTRDTSADAATPGSDPRSQFDALLAQLLPTASPAQRALLANKLLQANAGFLTSAVSLERKQELSAALIGVRTTVTLSASRSETSRLDPLANVLDDLSNGNVVTQRILSAGVSHRLTPIATLDLSLSLDHSSGTDGRTANLKSLTATWASRLSPTLDVSLGARHTVFDSSAIPYTETAIIATATLRF